MISKKYHNEMYKKKLFYLFTSQEYKKKHQFSKKVHPANFIIKNICNIFSKFTKNEPTR